MPTYRITSRSTGKVLDPSVQADSEASALAGFDQDDVVEQISASPPAAVFTIAYPVNTPRGVELVEVMTTGSRDTAQREMAKQPPGRTLIEETPAVNRQVARGRRS